MGRSITEGLYLSPLTRHGSRDRVSDSDVNDLEEGTVLYSIRGEAPEGWYNAGTKKHASKGSGYQDHQIFKKLPENKAQVNEPVEEKKTNKDKNKDVPKAKAEAPVAPSQKVTAAMQRSSAHRDEILNGDGYGAYGPKKSAFAERSSAVYNPNQSFQSNQQTTSSTEGYEQAQSFMQSKLNKTKNDFNFQPTLK